MKALRVTEGSLTLSEIEPPKLSGEALVRVSCSGICNTDVEIVRGYAGFSGTLGHEFVGVVEDSPGRTELVGKRVVGEINAGCGECLLCKSGDPRHCPRRTVLGIVGRDGAHAEYLTLPTENLLEIPDSITDHEAVFAEPLSAAIGITELIGIDKETDLAVVGDGKLGLLCAMALRLATPKILLIGRHSRKLRLAEQMDIETALDDVMVHHDRKFDVVVEASGSESGFGTALQLVRPRGKIVLKSTFHGQASWPASNIVVDEIMIVGSRCGRMAPAVDLLIDKKIDVTKLVDDEFPLTDGLAAFDRATEKGVLKVLIRTG
ncbi:MAG TPA: alcohol dehydrogenase catalytic domain-containing protein [Pyrinomonadaceae bacterium]|nr:alcohol dehydrogenase catalytic domain-containing protein [Pyrinomonadaceae bacterium]